MVKQERRVIVIGAVWNGLSVAKTYLQVNPSIQLTVLEAEDSLGGTWSSARIYPDLLTQQPYGQYEAADFPIEQRDPDQPGGYIPSQRIHSYLEEFATKFNVMDKIRFNAPVKRVTRTSEGDGSWNVLLEDGESLVADKLIVATGLTSLPVLPEIPTTDFKPLTFHSRYLGEHYDAIHASEIQTVTVYGGGKSAYDAANVAMRAGKKVQWILRTDGEGPTVMFNAQELQDGAANTAFVPAAGVIQPDPLDLGWAYWFFHSGKNWLGYWLLWWFWKVMTKKMLAWCEYDTNDNMRKLKPDHIDRALYWTCPAPFPVPEPELINCIKAGNGISIHRATIVHLSGKTVHLSDGTELETDVLIYATGYATHQPIFSLEDAYQLGLPVPIDKLASLEPSTAERIKRDEDAENAVLQLFPRLKEHPWKDRRAVYTLPRLYRYILPLPHLQHGERSIAFIGYLQGSAIPIIADVSSLWAVACMEGELQTKRTFEDVEREVDYLNAFCRLRWGKRGQQIPSALFEWKSTTDAMINELGIPLPDISRFKPWLPHVYRGLVDRWIESKKTAPHPLPLD